MTGGATVSQQRGMLGMSTLAFTLCFAVWTIFSIIGLAIKQDLGLSETQFGILLATPILTGSLSHILLGRPVWRARRVHHHDVSNGGRGLAAVNGFHLPNVFSRRPRRWTRRRIRRYWDHLYIQMAPPGETRLGAGDLWGWQCRSGSDQFRRAVSAFSIGLGDDRPGLFRSPADFGDRFLSRDEKRPDNRCSQGKR